MGHKIADKILFVLVVGISIGFTWFVSGGISTTLIYNFVFLGINPTTVGLIKTFIFTTIL